MSKLTKKLVVASGLTSVFFLAGCSSFVTDHGQDYQKARSSDATLQLPPGRHDVTDKLIIPNEELIGNVEVTGEFEAPRAPKPYQPMTNVPMVIDQFEVRFDIPAGLAQSKKLLTEYFSTFSGEAVAFESVSETSLLSDDLQFNTQGTLAKIWSSITRLDPTKYQLSIDFEPQQGRTLAAIKLVSISSEGERATVDLTLDESTAGQMVNAWSSIAKELSVETALLSNQGREPVLKSRIWSNQDGKLALYLGKAADMQSLNNYIRNTDGIHITNEDPLELSLVPQNQLPQIGDIVDFKVPLGRLGGENKEAVLFKVRRRNLDDVEWTERSYPYDLVRQQEGYFLTVDTSATENPTLTSYRILSLLAK